MGKREGRVKALQRRLCRQDLSASMSVVTTDRMTKLQRHRTEGGRFFTLTMLFEYFAQTVPFADELCGLLVNPTSTNFMENEGGKKTQPQGEWSMFNQ